MATITYCKALPEPTEELNALGITNFEAFLTAYAPIFRQAVCCSANHLLSGEKFNKSHWNTHLQNVYKINKRHANGVISYAKGAVDSARKCRTKQIKQLEGKLISAKKWLKNAENKLSRGRKFYAKKNWPQTKTGCFLPLSCSLKSKKTNWQELKFKIHHKKRYIYHLTKKIKHLKRAKIRVKIPENQVFIVGSKTETCGNQVCQWDGNKIKFRVPYCLEDRFGPYVETNFGALTRNINRLPLKGSLTWHFYKKQGLWVGAVQFTPKPVTTVSRPIPYGALGLDLNPGSIGWAYCGSNGNLLECGQISLQTGLPQNQQNAQIVNACLLLYEIAKRYASPVVVENLDFAKKKEQLREQSRSYARMLSSWAYSRFFSLLESILANRGIELIKVNPAYSSLIGLVKYARMYGLASDEAAALVIARRGMRLSERLPRSLTAYPYAQKGKHVWSAWNKLNKIIKSSDAINCRHDYYRIAGPDWESLVKLRCELIY